MALRLSSAQADELYNRAANEFGPALERLASAYEADVSLRQDLLQDIRAALWRSFHSFDNRCGLKTWVYRVAHNTAVSHVRSSSRHEWVSLEEVQSRTSENDPDRHLVVERLMDLIHQLRPLDRQIILLYLEGQDAAAIAEIMGISAANAGTKLHRVKNILTQRFHQGEQTNGTHRDPSRVAVTTVDIGSGRTTALQPVRTEL